MRRRQKVELRVKLRREKSRRWGVLLLGAALLGGALAGLSRVDGAAFRDAVRSRFFSYTLVEFSGLPEDAGARLRASAGEVPFGGEAAFVQRVSRRLPHLRVAEVKRSLWRRRLQVRWAARVPIARLPDGRVLDREGGIFVSAQEAELPLVEAAPEDGAGMAEVLAALEARSLPRVVRVRRPGGGWLLDLVDGTQVLWGETGRAEEKAARLAEALAEARKSVGTALKADLRFFEDGKVVVSAAPPTRAAARSGRP